MKALLRDNECTLEADGCPRCLQTLIVLAKCESFPLLSSLRLVWAIVCYFAI